MIEKIEAHYLEWGKSELETGNYEKAIYYYKRALAVGNKSYVRKRLNLAKEKLEKRQLEKFAGTWTKQMPGVTITDGN